ncbi:GNAT family N-acetyltransferase [Halosegnis sp.]|uniref:GNAT family N-acetyltransferase n=1 Tax=Halosegnis sp. TaxID=2864959 RepID=UPI0035D3FF1A
MNIREARQDERLTVRSIFDVAMLRVPDFPKQTLVVAAEDDNVLGAMAVETEGFAEPGEIHAIAVRPRRRGQGIGSRLVEEASRRWDPVVAEFDERVRPFYEAHGFDIQPVGGGRFRGVKPGDPT